MARKAIFGGTFDPIHNGHLNIAYEALNFLQLDNVIFMPSGNPPHKQNTDITDGNTRYQLIKMSIEGEKKFQVSDYEINREEFSYTYKTLKYFHDLEPDTVWYFLIGADCLIDIESWRKVDKIMEVANLVVFNRPGYTLKEIMTEKEKIEKIYGKKIMYLQSKLLDISSTKIRNLISESKDTSIFMNKNVFNKIKELNLYRFN